MLRLAKAKKKGGKMSKIDEAKLDEFVNIVKSGDADTIVCVAYSGDGEENTFFCEGRGKKVLAASASAYYAAAMEAGLGLEGAIKVLLTLSEDSPMKK